MTAYIESTKFLGYGARAPDQGSAGTNKFNGLSPLAPVQTGVQTSKFVGYAIIQILGGIQVATTESPDVAAINLSAPRTLSAALLESADTARLVLNGPNAFLIAATESPDSLYMSMGYRFTIHIQGADADSMVMILSNPGAWLNCTDSNDTWTDCPDQADDWTDCTDQNTTWNDC